MGQLIQALLNLQAVESDLAHVKGKLRLRQRAVTSQENHIVKLRSDWDSLHNQANERKMAADGLELELKTREEQVTKLRKDLNTAKTNKEYASILTQINTIKADNSKVEEETLKIMQEIDGIKTESDQIKQQLEEEEKRLEEIRKQSDEEIEKLSTMMAELEAKRSEAAKDVPAKELTVFKRMAEQYSGDAMAVIEEHGKRPPFSYICGGCFMSLNAEHANALSSRDEIRNCDNCGRILYLVEQEKTKA